MNAQPVGNATVQGSIIGKKEISSTSSVAQKILSSYQAPGSTVEKIEEHVVFLPKLPDGPLSMNEAGMKKALEDLSESVKDKYFEQELKPTLSSLDISSSICLIPGWNLQKWGNSENYCRLFSQISPENSQFRIWSTQTAQCRPKELGKYYYLAANQKNPHAEKALESLYKNEEDKSPEQKEGEKYFHQAANQGLKGGLKLKEGIYGNSKSEDLKQEQMEEGSSRV